MKQSKHEGKTWISLHFVVQISFIHVRLTNPVVAAKKSYNCFKEFSVVLVETLENSLKHVISKGLHSILHCLRPAIDSVWHFVLKAVLGHNNP